MKTKYKIRRLHRTLKAGYIMFALSVFQLLMALVYILASNWDMALMSVGTSCLIWIIGMWHVRFAIVRRSVRVWGDRMWDIAFRAGAADYARWLREREKKE